MATIRHLNIELYDTMTFSCPYTLLENTPLYKKEIWISQVSDKLILLFRSTVHLKFWFYTKCHYQFLQPEWRVKIAPVERLKSH